MNTLKLALLAALSLSLPATTFPFVHPGLLHTKPELAFIKSNLGRDPWRAGYAKLKSDMGPYFSRAPHAWDYFKWTEHGDPGPQNDLWYDVMAVYGNSVVWALEGKSTNAANAVKIINAWATKCKSISDCAKSKLPAGYLFPQMIWGAELLRHTGGWTNQTEIAQFESFLKKVVLPCVGSYSNTNNWRSWQNHCVLCIGVFTNDQTVTNNAVTMLKTQITSYLDESGKCDETCRDLHHTQMGIAPLVQSCEVMWKQGQDIYSTANNRLLKGIEYNAALVLGIPVTPAPGCALNDKDKIWPFYEMAYNHYNFRKKLSTPVIAKMVQKNRPEWYGRTGWGTVLHCQMNVGSGANTGVGEQLPSPLHGRIAPLPDGAATYDISGRLLPTRRSPDGSQKPKLTIVKTTGTIAVCADFLATETQRHRGREW